MNDLVRNECGIDVLIEMMQVLNRMRGLNAACTEDTELLDAAAKCACEQSADMGQPEVIRYRVGLWLLV